MKKKILSFILGIASLAVGTTTQAQAADKQSGIDKKQAAIEKVSKNFSDQFKTTIDPSIATLQDGFIVRSEIDGRKITSAYNKRGNWVYTVEGYSTSSLDKNIIETAMPYYPKYFITAMEKVNQPYNGSVYLVHIENSNSFKTLRVNNGTVELVQDVSKA